MKEVTVEIVDKRRNFLNIKISDKFYKLLEEGDYIEIEDFDSFEDDCVSKLDNDFNCEFQNRDVEILSIVDSTNVLFDEKNYNYGKLEEKLEEEVKWINKYLDLFGIKARVGMKYILVDDPDNDGIIAYNNIVEVFKLYNSLILDNYDEDKIQGWETLEDLENRLKELYKEKYEGLYKENTFCDSYALDCCIDDMVIVRELKEIMED